MFATDSTTELLPVHEKYQFKPLRGSSHRWALDHLRGNVATSRVLDVGAGGGGLGRCIREEAPASLVAVEPDLRAHETLSAIYDQVYSDIDSVEAPPFDWILVMDVLEHTPCPESFLRQVQQLLAPGGKILISVPNVAHWSVRIPLFFLGRFDYQPLGIMDRTHLHFFYKRSLHRLCLSLAGCRVVSRSASIEPFEKVLPSWLGHSFVYKALIPIRLAVARIFPSLFAYQLLAVVEGVPSPARSA